MNFKFENTLGDVTIITHSAEALQKMLQKCGIHVVYNYDDGTGDADNKYIYDAESLVKEFPNISQKDAETFFAGKGEIYDVPINNETYVVSLQYPIPEIGYED